MDESLDAVAFLARSEIRVGILRALEEEPRDRRGLEAATGASQSSLSRSLADLENRGWIRRTEGTYCLTTAGEQVIGQFVPLLETISGLQTLDDGLACLPVDEMDLDIRHFNDAELLTAEEFDPTAPYQYGIKRLRESTTVRSAARVVPPPYVRAIQEAVDAGTLSAEIILDSEYVEAFQDSEIGRSWKDIASDADVRKHPERIPYRLILLDDVVHLWLCSDEGEQAGLLESQDGRVREWAESTIDTYRELAEPISRKSVE